MYPAVGLQRPEDAHRVIGAPGPAMLAVDQELVLGWRHRQTVAAQQPPSRVAPGQAGLCQPIDRGGDRGRLTLEGIDEGADLDRPPVVQQQPEGMSEQGRSSRGLLGKREVLRSVGQAVP
jgi:hypothetical protein